MHKRKLDKLYKVYEMQKSNFKRVEKSWAICQYNHSSSETLPKTIPMVDFGKRDDGMYETYIQGETR